MRCQRRADFDDCLHIIHDSGGNLADGSCPSMRRQQTGSTWKTTLSGNPNIAPYPGAAIHARLGLIPMRPRTRTPPLLPLFPGEGPIDAGEQP